MREQPMPAVALQDAAATRSRQILDAGRELLLERGWDGFSMEEIAERVGCSRPLVYKHFSCKEEVLLALAIESKHRRVLLYERALMFRGRPRERMLALGEVERLLLPSDLPIELLVASTRMRAKTSSARQEELKLLDIRAISMGGSVVREAVAADDLALPRTLSAEDVLFFLWGSRWGTANLRSSDTPLAQAGIANSPFVVELSLALLLDGYGWRPLSKDWDYKATRGRVLEECFPPELVARILAE
jgi:AcrR family transcriptional regulator